MPVSCSCSPRLLDAARRRTRCAPTRRPAGRAPTRRRRRSAHTRRANVARLLCAEPVAASRVRRAAAVRADAQLRERASPRMTSRTYIVAPSPPPRIATSFQPPPSPATAKPRPTNRRSARRPCSRRTCASTQRSRLTARAPLTSRVANRPRAPRRDRRSSCRSRWPCGTGTATSLRLVRLRRLRHLPAPSRFGGALARGWSARSTRGHARSRGRRCSHRCATMVCTQVTHDAGWRARGNTRGASYRCQCARRGRERDLGSSEVSATSHA